MIITSLIKWSIEKILEIDKNSKKSADQMKKYPLPGENSKSFFVHFLFYEVNLKKLFPSLHL